MAQQRIEMVGAVVGEFVGGDAGLDYFVMVANGSMDTQLLFAGIIGLTIQGVAPYLLVEFAERLALPRHIISEDKGARAGRCEAPSECCADYSCGSAAAAVNGEMRYGEVRTKAGLARLSHF